ncbi:type II toxin-antitoxin system RelE/ParE family toxin [Aquabacter sp. CN5-332]|uniref:type II toxin-antitoxin system RelE/ParE family toxin n=1 Tax=Aquabacter sp. CN5-332 TaxID=3156608 RepID=UPI0032B3EE1C
MKVVVTAHAAADLESIADHIARQSPGRAESFIGELEGACLSLAGAAQAYPLVPFYEKTGIRRRVFGNYLIFFKLSPEAVEILRVLHGAMDYEAVLFPQV